MAPTACMHILPHFHRYGGDAVGMDDTAWQTLFTPETSRSLRAPSKVRRMPSCPTRNAARTASYRSWTATDLRLALAAVGAPAPEKLSLRAAERVYGVPVNTIKRHLQGQKIGVKSGRSSALSDAEDEALVDALIDSARRGFPATRFHLKTMVLDVISDGRKHQFGVRGPSSKWVAKFLDRHSDRLAVRKARILDSSRVNAADKSEIEYFFAEYIDFLKKHPLSPAQMCNCDETGVDPQGGTPKKVIAKKGAKEVAVRRGQDRENTTVLTAVSASGVLLPPLFVFKGKDLPSEFLVGAPPGSKATVTPSAFVDSQVFEEWVDHFIQSIPAVRPVLLVLDNHASHIGLPIRRKCISNGKRAASAKRKLLVAQDKAEKRRIRASNDASRSKASRNEVGQANAALIFSGRVPPCTSIPLPSEHVPTFPARQQKITLCGSDEDVVEVVCL